MAERRVRLAVLFIAVIAAAPLAQQRPPTPTFRSTTQYVAVDVIVTDSQDRIVRDLARDDFTVTEAGVVQTIDDFSFITVPLASRTIDVSAAPPPPADVGSNTGQPRASRAMAFVIDDIGLKPQDLIPLRRTMVKFLKRCPRTFRWR